MKHDLLFGSMSPEARRFYSRVFNTALLNQYAVRHGLFDVLLSETDDPKIVVRWQNAVPFVVEHIQQRKARGLGPHD